MVLRFLFRYLANNEHLVSRLAESYPIRRAAQLAAYLFTVSKHAASDGTRLSSLANRLRAQLKDVKEEFAEEMKKVQKK
ncbi:unnamed protein product [Timema podura]|nr:unnamed protein product [Timema bartmani]CAD7460415.1 unnamed protein product [Timema tahoe]CAG2061541.1 unnamed protein product [Timema podura]